MAGLMRMIKNLIKKKSFLIAGGIFYLGLGLPIIAEELSTQGTIGGDGFSIKLEPRDVSCHKNQQIKIGKMFCMAVYLKSANEALSKDLALKSFDAQMPEHRHGMVTRVKIKELKTGEYLIEGLKLHMPGEWRFDIQFVRGKEAAQVAIPLKL